MAKKVINRWLLFCEPCSHRQIITSEEPTEGLVEIKTSPIPQAGPVLDVKTQKAKITPPKPQPKKVKCPKCGRGVTIRKLPDVYANVYKTIDEEAQKQQAAAEKRQRIEDGKPHVRNTEEFLG